MYMEREAAEILKQVLYATVATVKGNGEPWISPVYAVYDDHLNFYWASGKTSRHSQNIKENSQVSVVIYDSTVPWGTGSGVFIEGRAQEVDVIDEIAKACQLRQNRVPEATHPPEEFTSDKPRSIYKLVPETFWMNQDARVNGYFVDERTPLNQEKLRVLLAGA